MRWTLSYRGDQHARQLADRHYSRQSIGHKQFTPPGRVLVLTTPTAYWVTSWPFSQYVNRQWPGAMLCSAFRNENPKDLSSELILDAVAATRWKWPHVPGDGMVTFVNHRKVKGKRDPGYCFICAGFVRIGETKGGLIALQLPTYRFPEARAPNGIQNDMFGN